MIHCYHIKRTKTSPQDDIIRQKHSLNEGVVILEIYKGFAGMYDEFMEDIPYDMWGDYIDKILQKTKSSLVVDLACGTGNMTLRLAEKGYDMIGVDMSTDMLAMAQQKSWEAEQSILFLAQDMRKLDLFGTIDAVVCVCDGLNYILNIADMTEIFKRVQLFLNPGGVFIFDMVTEYKFKEFLGQRSFEASGKSGISYELDNFYDEATRINEYQLYFSTGKEKFSEIHKQRAYEPSEIKDILLKAGFAKVAATHEYTDEQPRDNSIRLTYVAKV